MLNHLCGMRLCGRVYWIVSIRNILSAESEKTSLGNVLERVAFTEPAVLLENLAAFSRIVCAYAFVVVTANSNGRVHCYQESPEEPERNLLLPSVQFRLATLVCRWLVATG